jgi:hypothetical protein
MNPALRVRGIWFEEESEIPDLAHVDAGVVHLVDDALANGHPKP